MNGVSMTKEEMDILANEINRQVEEITLANEFIASPFASPYDIALGLHEFSKYHDSLEELIKKAKKWKKHPKF